MSKALLFPSPSASRGRCLRLVVSVRVECVVRRRARRGGAFELVAAGLTPKLFLMNKLNTKLNSSQVALARDVL